MSQDNISMPAASAGNSSFNIKEATLFIIYLALFASVVFSWRAISSICTPLLIVASFVFNKLDSGQWWNKRLLHPFSISCFIFFLVQTIGLLYTNHSHESTQLLFQKSSLVAFPLGICSSNYLNSRSFPKLMFAFVHVLAIAMLFCLANSLYKYIVLHADKSVFFYHTLVQPVLSHAIHFSIILFACVSWLLHSFAKKNYFYNRLTHLTIICFFFLFIILLSSKLIIVMCLLYTILTTGILSFRLRQGNRNTRYLITGAVVLIAGIVFFTNNPIQKRYLDIFKGSISWVFKQKKFDQGNYLNGVQFRLVEWRFVGEILSEQKAWLMGVSIGDAQPLLDKKYSEAGLYIGNGKDNRGFLGYNTHNQFLESQLQSGIPGLLAFGAMFFCLIQMILKRKNHLVSGIVVLLLLYTFNESYLETQYGIFLAIFLPLFFYYGTEAAGYPEDQLEKSQKSTS